MDFLVSPVQFQLDCDAPMPQLYYLLYWLPMLIYHIASDCPQCTGPFKTLWEGINPLEEGHFVLE
jgi:hypothetical protein